MKKIVTMLLAVCMIASIAVPASAAELGSSWGSWGAWFDKKPIAIHGDYDGDGDIDYDDVSAFRDLVADDGYSAADDWNGDGKVDISDVQYFYNVVKSLVGEETPETTELAAPAPTEPAPTEPVPTEPAPTEEQAAEYTVRYDANGGYFFSMYASPSVYSTKTVTVEAGKTLTISGAPNRTCYTFRGWETKDGTVYQAGEKIVVTQNLSLKAIWEYNG